MKKYSICKKLKDLREDRDMNRKEVAERIGIPSQNYSRYENGSREIPLSCIIALAKLYDVSADYLLGLSVNKREFSILTGAISDKEQSMEIEGKIASLRPENLALLLEYIDYLNYKQNKGSE